MKNLRKKPVSPIHKPFSLQPEYRTISTPNCGDASWSPVGFCVEERTKS